MEVCSANIPAELVFSGSVFVPDPWNAKNSREKPSCFLINEGFL